MLQLICETEDNREFALFCQKLGLDHNSEAELALVQTTERLELRKLNEPKLGALYVDFVSGAMQYRRKHGGGRGEAVAKACGIKKGHLPHVLDATAGLGRDAFVLASIGCDVKMVERHPVMHALLHDGLQRAYQDNEIGEWMQQRMQLLPQPTLTALCEQEVELDIDVVYLDPMYPHKQKSALVKKEMRIVQQLVGADLDADNFLAPARSLAKKRAVVKRPDYAPFLNQQKPSLEYRTKSHRFDIYLSAP